MAYQAKDGSGALFKSDKGDNPARPDYRGDVTVGGVTYELSAWIKESNGKKFMSLSAKPKDSRSQQQRSAPARQQRRSEFDDDAPF